MMKIKAKIGWACSLMTVKRNRYTNMAKSWRIKTSWKTQ